MDNLICGNSMNIPLADGVVQCVVTSPPYYGLRDYDVDGQLGLEQSPEEYVEKMVAVFREVKRVLRNDGTLWLNMGDSYAGNGGPGNWVDNKQTEAFKGEFRKYDNPNRVVAGLKPKDLIGIPWRLAFALQDDGWWLRSDIIWHKPNPMPESVTDRPTKSHEYLFLLAKSQHYYYDAEAITEPVTNSTIVRCSQDIENQNGSDRVPGKTNGNMKAVLPRYGGKKYTEEPDIFYRTKSGNAYDYHPLRNKRSVWTIPTAPYKGAHFATYPPALVEPCIKAGSKPGDIILDPFCGSGTTGAVAIKLGRKFVGIELSRDYIELARKRMSGIEVLLPLEILNASPF